VHFDYGWIVDSKEMSEGFVADMDRYRAAKADPRDSELPVTRWTRHFAPHRRTLLINAADFLLWDMECQR
jgi:hypothetical protein